MEPTRHPFPHLDTERLLLRQTTLDDADAVFAIFADPHVTQFHDLDTLTHVEQAIALIERRAKEFELGHGIRWGIALKANHRLLGSYGTKIRNQKRPIGIYRRVIPIIQGTLY
ncbi:GNAT family N-acetyltransferase [Trichocoleus sp. FACHB-262]|uniref:GNAT family N-acetyltransferase n=1 Tax=Trichocoleus sp. FACHB-262 TaxID=2692869 RepID=UPI0016835F23|nr:GNAT family N-acetyltransferase [Trichocoleus sp. FACHB-262]MBD2121855.1 GNAT family N-acetyltransferase [Trichocoleus sp. FACHB-262]